MLKIFDKQKHYFVVSVPDLGLSYEKKQNGSCRGWIFSKYFAIEYPYFFGEFSATKNSAANSAVSDSA